MVVYFSRSKKTEVFAKVLAELRGGLPLFELRSEMNDMPTMRFVSRALWLTVRGKSEPVEKMPGELPGEVFLCSPVWGGHVSPQARYFVENASLSDVRLNILLTASMPTGKYVKNAEKLLQSVSCIPGNVWIFASTSGKDTLPDAQIIEEHMKEIMQ